jgi:hypothetical protein
VTSRPLRVLAVSTDYPPLLGGIATLSSQMVREIAALGHEVKVVCGAPGGIDPVTGQRCDISAEHTPVGETLGLRELQLLRHLRRLLPVYRPDVVWSSTWFPGGAMVTLAAGKGSVAPHAAAGEPPTMVTCFSAYASEILPNGCDSVVR